MLKVWDNYRHMKTLTTLLFLITSFCSGAPISELQEIRLSKAELALINRDIPATLRLIAPNIISAHVHPPSYHFLADLYFKLGKISKGARVYYLLIKRLHSNDFLESRTDLLPALFKEVSPPGPLALEQYFKIATKYYLFASQKNLSKQKREKFLNLSYKYFLICEYYKYKKEQANYHLGVIQNKRSNYRQSIKRLLKAKKSLQTPKEKKALNLQLADSVIRSGQRDAGSLYLQSVFLSPTTSSNLKDYASAYLNALSSNEFYLRFSLGSSYNSNIHDLTGEQRESFQDQKLDEVYFKKDAFSITKSLNTFLNFKRRDHFSYFLNFYYQDNLKTNTKLSFQDSRLIFLLGEIRYDNSQKNLFKFNYSLTKSDFRETADQGLQTYSTTNTFTPALVHSLRAGSLQVSVPIKFVKYTYLEQSKNEVALVMSYTPLWVNTYFSPSYSLLLNKKGEPNISTDSREYILGFTNHTPFHSRLSHFLNVNIALNSNKEETLDYKELSINSITNIAFERFEKLNLSFSLDYIIKDQKIDDTIKTFSIGSEISYTF